MPRVGVQITDELHRISTELTHPGIEALWIAAKRRNLAVTRRQVVEYVRGKSEKQVVAPPQRALGKSISEDDNRWQMDLIDVSPESIPAGSWKFFLVCVNVFNRYLYARPLTSKEPREVALKLKQILDEARKKPQVISSDNGTEFGGIVAEFLQHRGIVQKFKNVGDLNALGLLDRNIGLLKRKLGEMHGVNGKSWAVNLPAALKGLNATPKPGVLHGAAPEDIGRSAQEETFMLLQDMARAIQHNKKLTETKTNALTQGGGTFRPQIALTRFHRNYQATYDDPRQTRKVERGVVTATTGERFPLKTVKLVAAGASAVAAGTVHARKLRDGGGDILLSLQDILSDGEPMAISKAARELRDAFAAQDKNYTATMSKVGGQLIDLIRAEPAKFKLVQRPHGSQMWYFVALA